jgi:hypothetical protein
MTSLVSGGDGAVMLNGQGNPRGTAFDKIAGANSSNAPTAADWASIWGPAAFDVNYDKDRNRRTSRMHLSQIPQELQGRQIYIEDRIDGLISSSTGSPFTSVILPYVHFDRPDNKISWRVFAYDEGLASRVPYESAARTLTQSREQFSAYATRHGLSITMEHNFMMSEEGRKDFYYQVQQVVGSIQKTNDLHVHMALIKCDSYFRKVREKYYRDPHSLEEEIRDYVNMFGFMQKNVNGLDILIEDAKQLLRGWGAAEPNFLLLNSRLTFNMQMLPERTQYLTQGPDGQRRLEQGPDVKSYRGIRIIHSRAFSIEEGSAPRDLLRRRVRVAEFYLLPTCRSGDWEADADGVAGDRAADQGPGGGGEGDAPEDILLHTGLQRAQVGEDGPHLSSSAAGGSSLLMPPPAVGQPMPSHPKDTQGDVRLYDEGSDSFVVIPYKKILDQCRRFIARANANIARRSPDDPLSDVRIPDTIGSVLLLRPNIEHQMLGIIMGKGGSIDDLGATLWGQTELSCFDDGQHGVWGMSYKYHASALVFNNRNLVRMWDIAYDGYSGGKDTSILDWGSETDMQRFIRADNNLSTPYMGPSIIALPLPTCMHTLPSPLPLANLVNSQLSTNAHSLATADLFVEDMQGLLSRVADRVGEEHIAGLRGVISIAYDLLHLHRNSASAKCANLATVENEATLVRLAYGGTYYYKLHAEANWYAAMMMALSLSLLFRCSTAADKNNHEPPYHTAQERNLWLRTPRGGLHRQGL